MFRQLFVFVLSWWFMATAGATCPVTGTLRVAVSDIPPMVGKARNGDLAGYDVELWKEVAREIGCSDYQFTFVSFSERIGQVVNGTYDVALGGITITADRETKVDFTHSYLNTGLGVMVRDQASMGFFTYMKKLWESPFGRHVVWLMMYLVIVSHIVWWADLGQEHFSDSYRKGIFEVLYFICTSVTTVGYGDFLAKTFATRLIVMALVFPGIGFTGIVLSDIAAFAINTQHYYSAESVNDLAGKRVAVVGGTTSSEALGAYHIRQTAVTNVEEAGELLLKGEVEAVVFDEVCLKNYLREHPEASLAILPTLVTNEDYGFALPENTLLREAINRALLHLRENGVQDKLAERYL